MDTIRYHDITSPSYVDGPGKRAALFVQGCSIRCPGCQNAHLWPALGGRISSTDALAACLLETEAPLTITGGEPLDQPLALLSLLLAIRRRNSRREIILYTGRTLEELTTDPRHNSTIVEFILRQINILVDGPYMQEYDHPGLQYRGSANQRVIDMPATLRRPQSAPALLNWDTPEIVITPAGLLGTPPALEMIGAVHDAQPARKCGQTL